MMIYSNNYLKSLRKHILYLFIYLSQLKNDATMIVPAMISKGMPSKQPDEMGHENKECISEVSLSQRTQNVKRSQNPLNRAMSKSQREQNFDVEAKELEADQNWAVLPRFRAGISEKPNVSLSVLVLKTQAIV